MDDDALIAELLGVTADPVPVLPGQPLTELHGIAAQHKLHELAQGVTVKTVTIDHAGRETVTTKQLPPSLPAAQAIAARFDSAWQGSAGQGSATLVVNVLGNTAQIVAHRAAQQSVVSTVPAQAEQTRGIVAAGRAGVLEDS